MPELQGGQFLTCIIINVLIKSYLTQSSGNNHFCLPDGVQYRAVTGSNSSP